MVVSRTTFFLSLFLIIAAAMLGSKLIWLIRSRKTIGYYAYLGQGGALDQIRMPYAQLYFRHKGDTVWFRGPASLNLPSRTPVQVRYLPGNPANAKVVTFMGLWGNTATYGGIILLMLIAVFLHPEIVPRRARLRLSFKRPFISIVQ